MKEINIIKSLIKQKDTLKKQVQLLESILRSYLPKKENKDFNHPDNDEEVSAEIQWLKGKK
jgi:hypothetical protein